MGLQQADHHIGAFPQCFLALLKHAAGLAHPRSHADEHLVAPAAVGGANHRPPVSAGPAAADAALN